MARTAIAWLALFGAMRLACAGEAGTAAAPESPAPGHYTVSPETSWIRILLFRGGLLGGLGHNHVVSASPGGRVEIVHPPGGSRISLEVPVASFRVDVPEERRAEGERFPGTLSRRDIAATRRNMLGPRLLDLAEEDALEFESAAVAGDLAALEVTLDFRIRGTARQLVFPATVEVLGNTVKATGERAVTHAELGLEPFSAALGTLRVEDELIVKYSIVAVRRSRPD